MSVDIKQTFCRAQSVKLIEHCCEKLEQLHLLCKTQRESAFFLASSLQTIAQKFFLKRQEVCLKSLEKDPFFDQHVFQELKEVVEIVSGSSHQHCFQACPSHEACAVLDLTAQEDFEKMQQEIASEVAKKLSSILEAIDDQSADFAQQEKYKSKLSFKEELAYFYFQLPSEIVKLCEGFEAVLNLAPMPELFYEKIRKKEHLVFSACLKVPQMFAAASENLKENKTFVLKLIHALKERSNLLFPHVSVSLRDDFKIAWESLKANASCYEYFSERLKRNQDILIYVVKHYPKMITKIPKDILLNKQLVATFVKINPVAQKYFR